MPCENGTTRAINATSKGSFHPKIFPLISALSETNCLNASPIERARTIVKIRLKLSTLTLPVAGVRVNHTGSRLARLAPSCAEASARPRHLGERSWPRVREEAVDVRDLDALTSHRLGGSYWSGKACLAGCELLGGPGRLLTTAVES